MATFQDDASTIAQSENIPNGVEATNPQTATTTAPEQTAPESDETSAPKPKPEPRLCGVCNEGVGKYKCPRCPLAYCSVACNKTHKENHPPPPPQDEQQQQKKSDTQPSNKPAPKPDPYAVLLQHRSEFDRLFRKYPGLESVLIDIQKHTLPPPPSSSNTPSLGGVPASIIQQTGGVSGVVMDQPKYGGGGRNNNHHNNNRQPQIWTGEVGLRRGADALRKARTDPGNYGDGVREFCEIVTYLLSTNENKPDGPNVTSLVREEVVADQARVIEQLLEVERDD